MQDDSIQSMGGKARAEALTEEQRREIAKKAAEARWSLPKATHIGELKIGNLIIPCAVLDNGERILADRSLAKALGFRGSGTYWKQREQKGAHLPEYVSAKFLVDFISEETATKLSQPTSYINKNGLMASGIKADLLPEVCDIWLKAREKGALKKPTHLATAETAYILLRGFAEVGIIALVDEATGYQRDRAKDALAEILEKFIARELQAWTRTFPVEFYEQIFRLKGWAFNPSTVKRPRCIGNYTNDIIYKRLAPGVLKELRGKNPPVDGRRKHKHFQWLTGEVGHPKLRSHIDGVLALMRVSESWNQFRDFVKKAYPVIETTELGFDIEVKSK